MLDISKIAELMLWVIVLLSTIAFHLWGRDLIERVKTRQVVPTKMLGIWRNGQDKTRDEELLSVLWLAGGAKTFGKILLEGEDLDEILFVGRSGNAYLVELLCLETGTQITDGAILRPMDNGIQLEGKFKSGAPLNMSFRRPRR